MAGARAYNMYWRQHLKPEESRDAILINQLRLTYTSMGLVSGSSRSIGGAVVAAARRQENVQRRVQAKMQVKAFQDHKSRIGMKANGLQKHFRHQNPLWAADFKNTLIQLLLTRGIFFLPFSKVLRAGSPSCQMGNLRRKLAAIFCIPSKKDRHFPSESSREKKTEGGMVLSPNSTLSSNPPLIKPNVAVINTSTSASSVTVSQPSTLLPEYLVVTHLRQNPAIGPSSVNRPTSASSQAGLPSPSTILLPNSGTSNLAVANHLHVTSTNKASNSNSSLQIADNGDGDKSAIRKDSVHSNISTCTNSLISTIASTATKSAVVFVAPGSTDHKSPLANGPLDVRNSQVSARKNPDLQIIYNRALEQKRLTMLANHPDFDASSIPQQPVSNRPFFVPASTPAAITPLGSDRSSITSHSTHFSQSIFQQPHHQSGSITQQKPVYEASIGYSVESILSQQPENIYHQQQQHHQRGFYLQPHRLQEDGSVYSQPWNASFSQTFNPNPHSQPQNHYSYTHDQEFE